ncbi:MAG: cytochrome c biogenesis protein DipZ [Solirubrobacterales bacterium]|nr:cytochrome c biogenesis protein DipZ [Solirubrobacterales bacterium]
MALLILFGFIAGAATAVSPCVLPVLPVALSAGATGGRRRPAGIVAGLTLSFTFATVALVYVIDALGLPDDLIRNIAIAVLIGFGLVLLLPALSSRLEGWVSRFTARFTPKNEGEGFWSGALVGASLGLVYAPCAGPILASVITVSASQSFTVDKLAIAFAYALGSALVLYLLMLGGRRLIAPLARRAAWFQSAMGVVMIVFGIGMAAQWDLKFQNWIADDLPAFVVNPTGDLEKSDASIERLAALRSGDFTESASRIAAGADAVQKQERGASDLPVIAKAPEIRGTQEWFNTPGNRPLTMAELRGEVVLIDFWTYTCINCIRTQPWLNAMEERYGDKGLTIIGVHTPEFPFERDASNVEEAIERAGIKYPVAQDNEYTVWDSYANRYWPAEYFVDAEGNVRYAHFGEGEYAHKEEVIRELLADAGRRPGGGMTGAEGISAAHVLLTPESYLGSARADRFENGTILPGVHDFGPLKDPQPDWLAYGGKWSVSPEEARSDGGQIAVHFRAKRVYLVLSSPGRDRSAKIELDGRPVSPSDAGEDVSNGQVKVTGQRLYSLINLPKPGKHVLTVSPEPGVSGYAFTFG